MAGSDLQGYEGVRDSAGKGGKAMGPICALSVPRPHPGGSDVSPAVPSCSIPGPCFILVSKCPSNEPFGNAPKAPVMQPRLLLPFP